MKNLNKFNTIPEPTLRRLSYYVVYLQKLLDAGIETVSSTQIANNLMFDPTQVRKDLQLTEISGHPKIGFNIKTTLDTIKSSLNWNNIENAFLVGVGNLGNAVLNFSLLKYMGVNIVAAFDNNPEKIGNIVNNVEILDIERLPELSKLMKVNIGIIAVPEHAAQETADKFVAGGIKAIWNLLPCRLKVPDEIIIEEANLMQSLAVLTNQLAK